MRAIGLATPNSSLTNYLGLLARHRNTGLYQSDYLSTQQPLFSTAVAAADALRLHEKGDKRRTIGLYFTAAQAIREYLAKAELTSGFLFRPRLGPRSRKLANRAFESSGSTCSCRDI